MKKELLTQLETLSYSIDYNEYCTIIDGASVKSFQMMQNDFNYWLNGYLDIENKDNFINWAKATCIINQSIKLNISNRLRQKLLNVALTENKGNIKALNGYQFNTYKDIERLIKLIDDIYKHLSLDLFRLVRNKLVSFTVSYSVYIELYPYHTVENYLLMISDFNTWDKKLKSNDKYILWSYYKFTNIK